MASHRDLSDELKVLLNDKYGGEPSGTEELWNCSWFVVTYLGRTFEVAVYDQQKLEGTAGEDK